jgi:RNA polymerase sigma factor (sigma-70 family)
VIAYQSLGSWRGSGPFGAWVARIAVRLALRQAGRRRPVTWIDPISDDGAASSARDPAFLAVRTERATLVRRAVAGLDEPYREVVALRFFGELSLAEIAATSGRPLGTVKTHLRRGLLRLREDLEAAGHEP